MHRDELPHVLLTFVEFDIFIFHVSGCRVGEFLALLGAQAGVLDERVQAVKIEALLERGDLRVILFADVLGVLEEGEVGLRGVELLRELVVLLDVGAHFVIKRRNGEFLLKLELAALAKQVFNTKGFLRHEFADGEDEAAVGRDVLFQLGLHQLIQHAFDVHLVVTALHFVDVVVEAMLGPEPAVGKVADAVDVGEVLGANNAQLLEVGASPLLRLLDFAEIGEDFAALIGEGEEFLGEFGNLVQDDFLAVLVLLENSADVDEVFLVVGRRFGVTRAFVDADGFRSANVGQASGLEASVLISQPPRKTPRAADDFGAVLAEQIRVLVRRRQPNDAARQELEQLDVRLDHVAVRRLDRRDVPAGDGGVADVAVGFDRRLELGGAGIRFLEFEAGVAEDVGVSELEESDAVFAHGRAGVAEVLLVEAAQLFTKSGQAGLAHGRLGVGEGGQDLLRFVEGEVDEFVMKLNFEGGQVEVVLADEFFEVPQEWFGPFPLPDEVGDVLIVLFVFLHRLFALTDDTEFEIFVEGFEDFGVVHDNGGEFVVLFCLLEIFSVSDGAKCFMGKGSTTTATAVERSTDTAGVICGSGQKSAKAWLSIWVQRRRIQRRCRRFRWYRTTHFFFLPNNFLLTRAGDTRCDNFRKESQHNTDITYNFLLKKKMNNYFDFTFNFFLDKNSTRS